jgi:hypothetical protein
VTERGRIYLYKRRIIQLVKTIVQDLVQGNLENLVTDGRSGELTKEQLMESILHYGGNFTSPPIETYEKMDIYEVEQGKNFTVDYDLWVDGKKSDLTLQCDVDLQDWDKPRIVITNIHVL